MLLDDLQAGGGLATDAAMRHRLVVMLSDASFNIFYDAGTLVVICRKPLGPYAEADCAGSRPKISCLPRVTNTSAPAASDLQFRCSMRPM